MSPAAPFLFCAAFTALISVNCTIFFGAKLLFGAPIVKSDAIVAVFGVAMVLLTVHFFNRYRALRGHPRA